MTECIAVTDISPQGKESIKLVEEGLNNLEIRRKEPGFDPLQV